jgi:hypothetical protein
VQSAINCPLLVQVALSRRLALPIAHVVLQGGIVLNHRCHRSLAILELILWAVIPNANHAMLVHIAPNLIFRRKTAYLALSHLDLLPIVRIACRDFSAHTRTGMWYCLA